VPSNIHHPLYCVWQGMRRRCLTPSSKAWNDYGGRGISICPEWDDFRQFVADMGARPSPLHTLDRVDNDGGYTPKNCRWATRKEQARNQRTTWRVTIEGKEYLVCDLVERFGLKGETIMGRASKGMSFEQVTKKTRYTYSGGARAAIAVRVANQLARSHCKNGHPWTPENTGQQKTGRYCRACHRLKVDRQRSEKRKGRP